MMKKYRLHVVSTVGARWIRMTYAKREESERKSDGLDSPVVKLVMTVMNWPKTRFTNAIPTPEPRAQSVATACIE